MDAEQLVAAVQTLQAGMTDLQTQLVNSRAESVQAHRDTEEMVQRIQQTDGNLVVLRAQNDV